MKSPLIHYFHFSSNFCAGYKNFLAKKQIGTHIKFNWYFFFFNFLWLSYHRMYKEMAAFMFIFTYITLLYVYDILTPQTATCIFYFFYALCCFQSYQLYFLKFNRSVDIKARDPFKKIRPFTPMVSFVMLVVTAGGFSFVSALIIRSILWFTR